MGMGDGAFPKGMIIAAPTSNSGKTTITLGLLRALSRQYPDIQAFKSGPDYIDPAFHGAAAQRPCYNLDLWSMRKASLHHLLLHACDADLMVIEGVMGLYDGAKDGTASTADLAHFLNLPVVLTLDVKGQATSAMAQIHGFRTFPKAPRIAGVIFNRVGSANHRKMLEDALALYHPDLPLLGAIPSDPSLQLPERHLGLVQAGEHPELETFLNGTADKIEAHLDLSKLWQVMDAPNNAPPFETSPLIPPFGQHIAIAKDEAFAFAYEGLLKSWKASGASMSFFSPLRDEKPDPISDAVYLPGGYPELHAERLSQNRNFLQALRDKATEQAFIFGECGGFMALGDALEDKAGKTYKMAGLLPVTTSFKKRKLHLGYRKITALQETKLGPKGTEFRGHEFHYSTVTSQANDGHLFDACDALGHGAHPSGFVRGTVAGSYLHLIDRV